MKTRNAVLAVSALLALVLGFAPIALATEESGDKTTMEELKKELGDAAQAIRNFSAEQRDEAMRKVKPVLDDLDARIERLDAQLREKWGQMDEGARKRGSDALEALRRQRNTVAEWYGALQHSTADAWEKTKKGFGDAFETLKGTWDKARKEIAPEP
ncbi:MAG: hypothetical protein AB1578_20385 [Thermodesulfobacteriota bacterium]|jgi:hypothetical protein